MALRTSDVKVGDTRTAVVVDNLSRTQIVQYAGASGDYNPIHTDEVFATQVAGYPTVFAHGMLTMGLTGKLVTDYVGDGTLTEYGVRFVRQVWPGDTLTATAEVTAVRPGEGPDGGDLVDLAVTTVNQHGEPVVTGTATARLADELDRRDPACGAIRLDVSAERSRARDPHARSRPTSPAVCRRESRWVPRVPNDARQRPHPPAGLTAEPRDRRGGRAARRRRRVPGQGDGRRAGDRAGRRVHRRPRPRRCRAAGPHRPQGLAGDPHGAARQRPLLGHVRPRRARALAVPGRRLARPPRHVAPRHGAQAGRRGRRHRRPADRLGPARRRRRAPKLASGRRRRPRRPAPSARARRHPPARPPAVRGRAPPRGRPHPRPRRRRAGAAGRQRRHRPRCAVLAGRASASRPPSWPARSTSRSIPSGPGSAPGTSSSPARRWPRPRATARCSTRSTGSTTWRRWASTSSTCRRSTRSARPTARAATTPTTPEPTTPAARGRSARPRAGTPSVHPELGTVADVTQDRRRPAASGASSWPSTSRSSARRTTRGSPSTRRGSPTGPTAPSSTPRTRRRSTRTSTRSTSRARTGRRLWAALADVVRFWIDAGVTIFRVDNPHTKPFAFWEWLIATIRREHPETIFLAEAFTRPRVMERLAKSASASRTRTSPGASRSGSCAVLRGPRRRGPSTTSGPTPGRTRPTS